MIITSLKAENVLKYRSLTLDDIPTEGIIAISGPNESGKSTIGETLCFGLFGRTFSVKPDDLEKLVLWGENHCQVTVGFEVDGKGYEVYRFLDRDGNHSARLSEAGAGEHDSIARGVQGVADALTELLGYEFDEFIESFYLAQREITTPHPHSQAVKIMAGVAPFELVGNELSEENAGDARVLEDLAVETEQVQREIDALAFDPNQEGELDRLRSEATTTAHELEGLAADLNSSVNDYVEAHGNYHRSLSGAGRMGALRTLLLLLALVAGGVWALLTYHEQLAQYPQVTDAAKTVDNLLHSKVPGWKADYLKWVGIGAGVLAVLMLAAWMTASSRRGRARQIAASSGQSLAAVLERSIAIEGVSFELEEVVNEEDGDASDDDAGDPPRADQSRMREFKDQAPDMAAIPARVREQSDLELSWLRHMAGIAKEEIAELDRAINDEIERARNSETLGGVVNGLQEKSQTLRDRLVRRDLAIELVNGASRDVSNHFNRDVRDLVSRRLPVFTEGRYEHLNIDEDLTVRVFSGDKRDFMDLDEVSSGTQRQIMLALRLALSQQLLNRTAAGGQFAFLDEPFAFFDEERTKHALAALTEMEGDLRQLWIVAQSFPAEVGGGFAAQIECAREKAELST